MINTKRYENFANILFDKKSALVIQLIWKSNPCHSQSQKNRKENLPRKFKCANTLFLYLRFIRNSKELNYLINGSSPDSWSCRVCGIVYRVPLRFPVLSFYRKFVQVVHENHPPFSRSKFVHCFGHRRRLEYLRRRFYNNENGRKKLGTQISKVSMRCRKEKLKKIRKIKFGGYETRLKKYWWEHCLHRNFPSNLLISVVKIVQETNCSLPLQLEFAEDLYTFVNRIIN